VSILLGNGDGTFQPAVAYAAGKSPGCVAVGDFNLDGSLDLVVNSDSNYITALLGNGDGTFRSPNPYPSLEHPGSLALGDFNGDGKPDLAISNSSFVVILLGNGDGSFLPPTAYNAGYLPIAVTVGDFNGDGKLDLAVGDDGPYLYQGYTGDTISILLGNGDGTFRSPISYTAGSQPVALALGDFNGDGSLDVAVLDHYQPGADGGNGGNLAILLGTPQGAVQHTVTYPVSPLDGQLSSMAAGDFNGDGKPDLALTDSLNSTVTILLNDSPQQSVYPVGPQPGAVVVADFNRDGKLDLAVTNYGGSTVSILLGNGDGTFQPQVTYAAGGQPVSLAIGDFNGDGNLDLAVVLYSTSVSILLGNGDGAFQPPVAYGLPNAPSAPRFIAVGDLNGDGNLDLVVDANAGSLFVGNWILPGNGDGTFQPAVYSPHGPAGYVVLADVNGDGILDMVTGEGVLLGNGNATFQKLLQFPGTFTEGPFSPFATADFNGDGKLDVAVLTKGIVGFLLGNGDGTFRWEASFVAGNTPSFDCRRGLQWGWASGPGRRLRPPGCKNRDVVDQYWALRGEEWVAAAHHRRQDYDEIGSEDRPFRHRAGKRLRVLGGCRRDAPREPLPPPNSGAGSKTQTMRRSSANAPQSACAARRKVAISAGATGDGVYPFALQAPGCNYHLSACWGN
jgi:hypothetical protein